MSAHYENYPTRQPLPPPEEAWDIAHTASRDSVITAVEYLYDAQLEYDQLEIDSDAVSTAIQELRSEYKIKDDELW